jgi:biotin carboxyl carrier protein
MKMRITVEGVSYEVEVEMLDNGNGSGGRVTETRPAAIPRPAATPAGVAPPPRPALSGAAPAAGSDGKQVKSPIAGTVQSVAVKVGDAVEVNDTLLVLEAMKMESAVASPIAGVVKAVHAEAGKAVRMADVLVEFE